MPSVPKPSSGTPLASQRSNTDIVVRVVCAPSGDEDRPARLHGDLVRHVVADARRRRQDTGGGAEPGSRSRAAAPARAGTARASVRMAWQNRAAPDARAGPPRAAPTIM